MDNHTYMHIPRPVGVQRPGAVGVTSFKPGYHWVPDDLVSGFEEAGAVKHIDDTLPKGHKIAPENVIQTIDNPEHNNLDFHGNPEPGEMDEVDLPDPPSNPQTLIFANNDIRDTAITSDPTSDNRSRNFASVNSERERRKNRK